MRVQSELRRRLETELQPEHLAIEDQSASHAGHGGARPAGETHFRVELVSPLLAGRSRIDRQRMVYRAAGDLLQTDIHALSITALAPGEPGSGTST